MWCLCFQQMCWAFLAFLSVGLRGCCFVQVKACLLYSAGMCMYLWSARLMVVSFLLCWTIGPTSLFLHLLFNQPAKALFARSLYWKLFLLFAFARSLFMLIHVAIYIYSFHGLPFWFRSFIYMCLQCQQIYNI